MKNELQVEQYDALKAAAKKKKMLQRVATGVGAAALVTVLGCYGLRGAKGTDSTSLKKDLNTAPMTIKNDLDTVPVIEPIEDVPMRTFMMGGNGAWFNSVIEFLEA